MKHMTRISLVLLAVCFLAVSQAGAGVDFSLPSSAYIQIPTANYFGGGPQSGVGYTWTSTNTTNQGGSVFGLTSGYGFGNNGIWDGALGPMAGVNDSYANFSVTDTMTFAFTDPVSIIGGFMNYVPGGSTPTTIAVYDSGMNLIESYNLTFLTGQVTDAGQTLGFQEATADISYFTMTGNYIGIVSVSGTNILSPEPGSMMLLGSGILLAIGLGRRRFSR
jgi:hypothetical protein